MNADQQLAVIALADGGVLADPKYFTGRQRTEKEAALKASVKRHWHLRPNFPSWVSDYCAAWSDAATRSKSTIDENHHAAAVGSDGAR